MTELEALRRVAEAARKWRFIGDHTSQWEATERVEALEQAIDELDALPAPAAEPEVVEVVEVVAAVGWHPGTRLWSVRGWSNELLSDSQDVLSQCRTPVIATIRARVPLPRVPEVVGEVG